MEATGQRAVSRALAVVALVAGLLAMHGLATGHHAPAHASGAPTAHAVTAVAADAASAAADDGALPPHHAAEAVAHVPTPAEQLLTLGPPGECGSDCPDAAAAKALCLAVLTGLALALHLARSRHVALLHRRRGAACRPRAPGAAPHSCPDLVSELCISRT